MTDDDLLVELLRYRPDAASAAQLASSLGHRYPDVDAGGLTTRTLVEALDEVWERGWQPADVAHAARREATTGSVPLVVALIGAHARRTDAERRAPETWVGQLRELGALGDGDGAVVAAWQRSGRRSPAEAWRIVLQLLGVLRGAARIDVLVPPPSRWVAARTQPAGPPAPGDDRALRRIRGLLAKAESTEFAEEAEALTAKAQELMTRHAVDVALLAPDAPPAGDVATRRVHVGDPYVRAKMQVLAAVAEANDVRLVWYQGIGIANLVGARADLDAVELLFTSLLLQVAQALAAAERRDGRRSASRTFRRAFLLGYGQRIGERLQTARREATTAAAEESGLDLLPVLRNRREAVDAAVTELFPKVRASRSRASVDAGGWYAGRSAAERADVGSRHSPLT
ncbi:DUF2786 domain-containing protein [Blastococcus sp. CCUG 61487]|uniref:DUF2786 domain-containing protein n=1 Tax=Blastococcus sp. CCUG 61487 TaxID=1840703 RepID=UPI0010C1291D|nr:DUF2786 domain-containing protein [Blastococcus sp. CCUG 61487]